MKAGIKPIVAALPLVLAACAAPQPPQDTFLCHAAWRSQRCAAVPFAPDETEAQAKTFEAPPAGSALLYLYRPYLQQGMQTTRVEVDGCPAGSIAARSFLVLELPPGRHRLTLDSGAPVSRDISVEGGRLYYLQYRLDLLLSRITPVLEPAAEDEAQREIRALRLAAAERCSAR